MRAKRISGLGFDTLAVVDPAMAGIMRMGGYGFVFRYLARGKGVPEDPPSSGIGNLARLELDWLLEADLAVGLVQRGCSRTYPTASIGSRLGDAAVVNAGLLGVPQGTHLFCSLEYQGSRTVAPAAQSGCIEAYAAPVVAAGYRAGYYGSFDGVLDDAQLYALRGITCYWASATWYPRRFNPSPRGWGIQQGPQTEVLGLPLDPNIIVPDGTPGGLPWLIAA
jgi:hypothetical protein